MTCPAFMVRARYAGGVEAAVAGLPLPGTRKMHALDPPILPMGAMAPFQASGLFLGPALGPLPMLMPDLAPAVQPSMSPLCRCTVI